MKLPYIIVVFEGYRFHVLGIEASVVTLMATCYIASTGLCSDVAANCSILFIL